MDELEQTKKVSLLFGAENQNVFIGAFSVVSAAREAAGNKRISFHQFLAEVAPYGTEDALQSFLEKRGFEIVPMFFREQHNDKFVSMFNGLLMGYERMTQDLIQGKERILVEHEAQQFVQLLIDEEMGFRSVFVANDRKLQRAASLDHRTRDKGSSILPPQSFVGLVDIVVGFSPDSRGLARLFWASPRRDSDRVLRDYLVKRALLEQDVALAKASAQVISEIVDEAKVELKAGNVNLYDGGNAESLTDALSFVDRFEDRFFEKMRRAIERQES